MDNIIDFPSKGGDESPRRFLACDKCDCCEFTLEFCKEETVHFIEAVCLNCSERYKISKVKDESGELG